MALSRGKTKIPQKNIQEYFVKDIPGKIAFQNEKIINILRKKLKNKKYRPPFNEIESIKSKKFSFIYFLHKHIIKKIGSLSSMKIEKNIFKIIEGHPKTILDASCGDSPIINNIYNKYNPDICIGNDISWKTISLIKNKNSEIIFTNHNVLDLPYKIKFDLVIFKNTLHHIEREDQLNVFKNLLTISRQLIIIDIDNPKKSNLLSKLWNNYYVYLLGDQGNSFLTLQEFKKFINQIHHAKFKIGVIRTIKGNYYYASIKN
jgi:SAM-dependent methyltransferase